MFAMPSVKHCVKPAAAVISQDGANFEISCDIEANRLDRLLMKKREEWVQDVAASIEFKPFDG